MSSTVWPLFLQSHSIPMPVSVWATGTLTFFTQYSKFLPSQGLCTRWHLLILEILRSQHPQSFSRNEHLFCPAVKLPHYWFQHICHSWNHLYLFDYVNSVLTRLYASWRMKLYLLFAHHWIPRTSTKSGIWWVQNIHQIKKRNSWKKNDGRNRSVKFPNTGPCDHCLLRTYTGSMKVCPLANLRVFSKDT